MSARSDPSPAARILRERPFAGVADLVRVEPVDPRLAHSGTAFFVTARDGRRFKLRDGLRRRRAAAIERHVRALSEVFPPLLAREGRYLLLAALEDYRPVTRRELLRSADRLGRMTALAHVAGRPGGLLDRLHRRALAGLERHRFRRDLALLRRTGTLPAASCEGAARKYRAHRARFGLPIALELDDFHKGNVMIRESDGDLRYVDEEGVALRPKGTGMASFLKTANRQATQEYYRMGYESIAPADFITPAYTEYLLLMDAVRRVAFKVRAEVRLRKLPREVAELRAMADHAGISLDWRFPRD